MVTFQCMIASKDTITFSNNDTDLEVEIVEDYPGRSGTVCLSKDQVLELIGYLRRHVDGIEEE